MYIIANNIFNFILRYILIVEDKNYKENIQNLFESGFSHQAI